MKKFLQQVAEAYYSNERMAMARYSFVFPNRRAGSFFLHYLRQAAEKPTITPEVTTMGELVAGLSGLTEASRIEQLLILYNCYRKLSDEIPDFDRFRFWGETLLSDFDDVDLNLAAPDEIFKNVSSFKEISSNYLTDEQRDIIGRYWPESFRDLGHDDKSFWKHVGGDTPSQRKFLRLWEILSPLYGCFRKSLRERGLSTRGMFYRDAASLSDMQRFVADRYVFVGFNQLSVSELKLMERLQALGKADFYWKRNVATFRFGGNNAVDFIDRYAGRFVSRYDIAGDCSGELPFVTVVASPSKVAQADMCGETIAEWIASGQIRDRANAIDTAIVLPDESMLIPTVAALPGNIPLNVTMGVPMRQTPVASFMSDIMALNMHSRRNAAGELMYYHEDVRRIVSNPFVKAIAPDECHGVLSLITEKRLFMVSSELLSDSFARLSVLFSTTPDSGDFTDVSNYIADLLDFVDDTPGGFGEGSVERFYIRAYRSALHSLCEAVGRHSVDMRGMTVFHLLEQTVGSSTIRFEGQPLRGLQVMGVLETRALDFDNIIVMSMNEKIFPRRHYNRSFIPDNLRSAYGLPTMRFAESSYAYYFYSMISRAKNVTLYYDGRKGSSRGGEMSRYLSQLLYLSPPGTVKHSAAVFGASVFKAEPIIVHKTPEIMAKLGLFRSEGDDRRFLSASAINEYINCPLNFYLSRVEGLNQQDEITEYMDSSTYGSVVHRVAESIYMNLYKGGTKVITSDIIEELISDDRRIDALITEAVNYCHNSLGRDNYTPLQGEASVLAVIIKRIIIKMLGEERKFTPFEFVAAEFKDECRWEVSPGLTVNFKMYIDRIDRVSGDDGQKRLRFVDYKTGSDKIRFSNVGQLFDSSKSDRRKAILQLYLYSGIYSRIHDYNGPIQPYIYQLKTIFTEGLNPLMCDKSVITDYRDLGKEVFAEVENVVNEIFDPETDFTQAVHDHACVFCQFKALCNRDPAKP